MPHPQIALFLIAVILALLATTVSPQFAALMGLPITVLGMKLRKSQLRKTPWRKP